MIKPILSSVLIEPIKREDTTKAGIILPDEHTEPILKGKILAIGEGRYNYPIVVKVGQVVYYRRTSGFPFEGKLIMEQDDILGVE